MAYVGVLATPVLPGDQHITVNPPFLPDRFPVTLVLDPDGANPSIVAVRGTGAGGVLYVDRGSLGTDQIGYPEGTKVTRYAPTVSTTAPGAHPNLATHDALGLATQAELDTHAASPHGGTIPAGLIVMWGGLVVNIPSGWVLCDGNNGTPDLRGLFVKGASGNPGSTGGAATHSHAAHVFTQPSDHAALAHSGTAVSDHTVTQASAHTNHVFTQPGNHAVTQPAAHASHVFTQPAGHSNHAVTQPANHSFTQPSGHSAHVVTPPSDHSALTNNHSGAGVDAHAVTQPSAHADNIAHTHVQSVNSGTTGALSGYTPDTSTSTSTASGYSTASSGTGASLTHSSTAVAAHVFTQPSAHGAISSHAGSAVDGHSAHAGGAVDAHSATAVDAHSVHSGGTVDAHSVHSGSAVDAHAGGAVDAHSAHSGAGVSAHGVTQASQHAAQSHAGSAVDAHTASNSEPAYYSLAYIQKT